MSDFSSNLCNETSLKMKFAMESLMSFPKANLDVEAEKESEHVSKKR